LGRALPLSYTAKQMLAVMGFKPTPRPTRRFGLPVPAENLRAGQLVGRACTGSPDLL